MIPTNVFSTAARTAAFDLALVRRYPRLLLAICIGLLVPAVYAGIYLSSMWDPASHTRSLKVGLVNQDQPVQYQGNHVALGDQVVKSLLADQTFSYEIFTDKEEVRHAVRTGEISFAVLVPPDFSRLSITGASAGAGRLTVYVSEGNNYAGAGFARRFAPELAHRVNQALNQQRWDSVIQASGAATIGLDQLRDAITALLDGATRLNTGLAQARGGSKGLDNGSRQLADGSVQMHAGLQTLDTASAKLTEGMSRTAAAIRALRERQPASSDLQALNAGMQQLTSGQGELGQGLKQMQDGAAALRDGAEHLGEQSKGLLFGSAKVVAASGQLAAGAGQLHKAIGDARAGSDSLAQASARLGQGTAALTDGVARMGTAIGQLAAALPEDRQLTEYRAGVRDAGAAGAQLSRGAQQMHKGATQLDHGLEELLAGSERLQAGLAELSKRLPDNPGKLDGSASGLSESVQPVLEIAAPVANQGSGFSPNFIPLALWVGATLCTFLFNYRDLPASLAGRSRLGLVLGKHFTPMLLIGGQVMVLLAMLYWLLGVHVDNLPRLLATLLLTGWAFLTLVFALICVLGDAGKLLALVLLVLQLAAAGATMPIELTTTFFQTIHPYMPLTWVVRTVRIAMFGAFEGVWLQSAAMIALVAVLSTLATVLLARFNPVDPANYRPQIAVD